MSEYGRKQSVRTGSRQEQRNVVLVHEPERRDRDVLRCAVRKVVDAIVLLPVKHRHVALVVGRDEVRLELVEHDAGRHGVAGDVANLLVPSCAACVEHVNMETRR